MLSNESVAITSSCLAAELEGRSSEEISSASLLPILKLRDIIHNFPSYAPKLSSMKLKSQFRESMSLWREYGLTAAIPSNAMFINGIMIPLGNVC